MLKSNTQYDFRLEDITNLSGTILLLIVVQMYEFQEKLEKFKKTKLWITTENKKNKQIRVRRFSLFLVVVFGTVYKFILGIIHLVRLQYFPRN